MSLDLAAIRARAAAATAGPWMVGPFTRATNVVDVWRSTGEFENELIAEIEEPEGWGSGDQGYRDMRKHLVEGGDFIAHARQDVPALVDQLEQLTEAARRLALMARTTGGTAGPDLDLMQACAAVEDLLVAITPQPETATA